MSTTKHANDTIFDNCYATEFSRILDATPDDGKKEAIANILSYFEGKEDCQIRHPLSG